MTSSTASAPELSGLHQIPAAAWSRPIGAPLPEAGRGAEVGYVLVDDGPFQGLPIGGLGSGSIGRTFRGDFARWHLDPGVHSCATSFPNQFSLYVEKGGRRLAQVLCTEKSDEVLRDWQWGYPQGAGTYHALFPRAWFTYDWDELPIRLSQEQFSPVIPGNYRESSYPVAVFEWRAENPGTEPVRVGLMLTWENFVGRAPVEGEFRGTFPSASPSAERYVEPVNMARGDGKLVGVEMGRSGPSQGPRDGSVAIVTTTAPGVSVSYRSSFTVDGSGAGLWNDFAQDGRLDDIEVSGAGNGARQIAAALAVSFELQPGETKVIPFALAWDFPVCQFPSGQRWHRHHTRFFGTGGDNAWRIAAEALEEYPRWREAIEDWQAPILADVSRPEWYKTALFNELYFLVDGGTIWGHPIDRQEDGEDLFGYLECYDYPFYGTLDVAFYSSWALLQLWPALERQEIIQFAGTVHAEDLSQVRIQATGRIAPRKLAGALPHDLGAPHEDPLLRANAYSYQDINDWKDLNLKYVLRVYRDHLLLDDGSLLDRLWPTVAVALEYLRRFDSDGDGLLDHHGADQTYDTWEMEGASAYTGGLLIAALEAASEMARIEGDEGRAAEYKGWLARARASFEAKLWNGRYYLYNAGNTPGWDSVMADQLCGQWYAGALGLPSIAPRWHVRTALQTIFDRNVMGFARGTMGAVNGVRPDGTVDRSSNQSQEVWSGVTYALAALMLQEGLDREAWQTAWGAYNVTYVTRGFWFRTPEAWYEDGSFRACLYMRPQSIWAIEHALGLRRLRTED